MLSVFNNIYYVLGAEIKITKTLRLRELLKLNLRKLNTHCDLLEQAIYVNGLRI